MNWTKIQAAEESADRQSKPSAAEAVTSQRRVLKSLKWGMVQLEGTIEEKFRLLKELGFDGVELDSPSGIDVKKMRSASESAAFPIDGTVDSTHWKIRLTDRDAAVRQQGLNDLKTAIFDTDAMRGHSVLLVPGHGQDGTAEETLRRSSELIRQALPLAARLGVFVLIENVWNEMFYDKDGNNQQTADALAEFVDSFHSPWVGVQFDIGNHQKFGPPAAWIRTLGKRIVKLDVKDWGSENGFCKIGDGDVDWEAVREALAEIEFTGWAAAEVSGGGRDRLRDISQRMDRVLGLN